MTGTPLKTSTSIISSPSKPLRKISISNVTSIISLRNALKVIIQPFLPMGKQVLERLIRCMDSRVWIVLELFRRYSADFLSKFRIIEREHSLSTSLFCKSTMNVSLIYSIQLDWLRRVEQGWDWDGTKMSSLVFKICIFFNVEMRQIWKNTLILDWKTESMPCID